MLKSFIMNVAFYIIICTTFLVIFLETLMLYTLDPKGLKLFLLFLNTDNSILIFLGVLETSLHHYLLPSSVLNKKWEAVWFTSPLQKLKWYLYLEFWETCVQCFLICSETFHFEVSGFYWDTVFSHLNENVIWMLPSFLTLILYQWNLCSLTT